MAVPTLVVPDVSAAFEQLARDFARGASALRAIPRPSIEVGVSVTAAVEAGVAFLDERYGRAEWLQRVNLDTLDVHSQLDCVLAQVTGKTYVEALDVVGVPTFNSGFTRTRWTDARGFSRDLVPEYSSAAARYAQLTNAWATKITELRAGVA